MVHRLLAARRHPARETHRGNPDVRNVLHPEGPPQPWTEGAGGGGGEEGAVHAGRGDSSLLRGGTGKWDGEVGRGIGTGNGAGNWDVVKLLRTTHIYNYRNA